VYADAGAYAQMARDVGAAYVLAAIEAVTS